MAVRGQQRLDGTVGAAVEAVGDAQQAVCRLGPAEAVEVEVDLAHILAALGSLGHQHRAPVGRGNATGLAAGADQVVGVSADDHVDAAGLGGQVEVARGHLGVVADMGHGHHRLAALDIAQPPGGGVGGLDGVEILHAVVVARGNHALGAQVDADKSDAVAVKLAYGVAVKLVVERRGREVVVGGDEVGVGLGEHGRQRVDTVVKLMIAQYAQVVAQGVHGALLHLASVEIEKERALHGVAGVDEHHMVGGGAHAVDEHLAAGYAAAAVGVGQQLRVGIVGVQQHEAVGGHLGRRRHDGGHYGRRAYGMSDVHSVVFTPSMMYTPGASGAWGE